MTNTGHDEDGNIIRSRLCSHCGTRFGTVEVVLPSEFSFSKTDTYRSRDRSGRVAFYSSDRIFIGAIKIIKGKRSDWCAKGLHKLRGKNLRLDNKHNRHCRACENENARLRRLLNKEIINQRERERYHRKRGTKNYTPFSRISGRIPTEDDLGGSVTTEAS